ncbi:hypothetical protein FLP41_06135 [Paracoccus marcusii]|uniref:hypothetical protein n=1 Tax=Paracoccus marcusii TaxID=59779 RepID=UPI002ED6614D|nr:hypothetical protein FLP41_06135 [Paracoccus marcusii]
MTQIWTHGIDRDAALRLTAAAEARSEHPGPRDPGRGRRHDAAPAQSVTALPGRGLTAMVEGGRC